MHPLRIWGCSSSSSRPIWPLPRYWDDGYLAALSDMVHALAERYADDPRVAWVEISVGIYGETTPVNEPALKWACAEAGLTSEMHVAGKGRLFVDRDSHPDHRHLSRCVSAQASFFCNIPTTSSRCQSVASTCPTL